ncbi:MAG: tRNA (adenosine(37)-N6)-threonylcarbamoyltransferase complex ATPase subunit type 1 TsaE, partial [Planctomycetaceae bacterium]|nr:tRNA (adenosine(37)-N6)-threonylcarbamoyltransferase complex ATPase subunit type 1 TsaE [Planctomycetaceae bacterium]
MKITTYSHDETLAFGKRLGQCFEPRDIVLLFGDLGAGKTTLTHGLCLGLGLAEDDYIRSPTFTLVNEYQGTATIYHIDLYRLDSLR